MSFIDGGSREPISLLSACIEEGNRSWSGAKKKVLVFGEPEAKPMGYG